MRRRALVLGVTAAGFFGATLGACGSGESPQTGGSGGGGATPTTTTTEGMGGSGGLLIGGGAPGCMTSDQCDGGVCVNGICCATAEQACASTCCQGEDVCLFDACVTPGKPCHTANDCDPGQYCETALGDNGAGGGGVGGGGGGLCTAPLPLGGKCLDLPPKCDENGEPTGCIPPCEYHPPPGALDAVMKWEWGPVAGTFPNATDVWSTPTVGRVYDANCDGKVDALDPPNIIFVSAEAIDPATGKGTCCHCTNTSPVSCRKGVLRVLDGRTGQEIWSLDKPEPMSSGFAGNSVAIGDVDGDQRMDIVALTGEGYIVMVDANGNVVRKSDQAVTGSGNGTFGWGGGVALADMNHDGSPEILYANRVYSTLGGGITEMWVGAGGIGGYSVFAPLSTAVDLDGAADGNLELLAGRTAYNFDGSMLWNRADLPDGFPAVGDFDADGAPEVVLIANGQIWVLAAATGATLAGPLDLAGTGNGGPPTVADFDGDGTPEIGVATQTFYSVVEVDIATATLTTLWQTANHDLSSSVTGSSVFDFEGDGQAEVVYNDECFIWVYDGATGAVRFSAPTTSFTATEASIVADVDGDGHAEIVRISNRADPSAAGWGCMDAAGNPSVVAGVTWTPSPAADKAYAGIAVFGDKTNSWVGTRTLWSQHTYHVTNTCDDRDSACVAPNVYGSIPQDEQDNWTLPWLNNFRQNVQDKGLFDAPDATLTLSLDCLDPIVAKVSVRNLGLASLPAGVVVNVVDTKGGTDVVVGEGATTHALFPGQTEVITMSLDPAIAGKQDTYQAVIVIDPANVTFHECKDDNNKSQEVTPTCVE